MKKVLLLLANGFEVFEASVFIDVIGWNLIDGDKSTKLFTCGLTKEVKTTFDQKVIVDYLIDEINVDEFSALAIPGGFEEFGFYLDAYSDKFSNLIKEFHKNNKIIASICVASLPIAKTGILNGKKATTYFLNPIRQEQLKNFGAEITEDPIVITDKIITSFGPSTAIEVALILLEMLTTKENANHIKRIMGFGN